MDNDAFAKEVQKYDREMAAYMNSFLQELAAQDSSPILVLDESVVAFLMNTGLRIKEAVSLYVQSMANFNIKYPERAHTIKARVVEMHAAEEARAIDEAANQIKH